MQTFLIDKITLSKTESDSYFTFNTKNTICSHYHDFFITDTIDHILIIQSNNERICQKMRELRHVFKVLRHGLDKFRHLLL